MARIEVEPTPAPEPESEEAVPQITGEGGHMQQLLDQARKMQGQTVDAQPSATKRPVVQAETIADHFDDFFDTGVVEHEIPLETDAATFKFYVIPHTAEAFLSGDLKIPEGDEEDESDKSTREAVLGILDYFVRALVRITRTNTDGTVYTITADSLAADIPKVYSVPYYNKIRDTLVKKFKLTQITDILTNYAKFFTATSTADLEKKT